MSLELVFLTYFMIRINYHTHFITTDKIFFIIRPTHGLNSFLMDRCNFFIFKIWSMPNNYFSTARSCDYSFATFFPSDRKQRIFLFMLLFCQIFWTSAFPISMSNSWSRKCIFSKGWMRNYNRSVWLVKIIFFVMPIVSFCCHIIKLSILLL